MSGARGGDAGFTLIEVVVALALFALVAAAGAALVTTMLDARRHTAGRLDRLADIQRTMTVATHDFSEITDAPLTGSSSGVTFTRHRGGWGAAIGTLAIRYTTGGEQLQRIADGRPQVLLNSVTALRLRYYSREGGWQDLWPAGPAQAAAWPAAVSIDLDLHGTPPNGHLRRIVDLPVRPLPPLAAVSQTPLVQATTP